MPWSGTARNMLQLSPHADLTTHTLLAQKQRTMAAILKFSAKIYAHCCTFPLVYVCEYVKWHK